MKIVADPNTLKEYLFQLHGTPYTEIDIPKVRKAFIERFYPNLTKKEGKKTFIDEILGL